MPTAVQAHRGSPDRSAGILENTVEAFLRARRLGADSVELDVRATADGSLAVHHDPEIPGAGPVHLLTTAELPPHVPLLADALGACAGMDVNVEIKNLPTEAAFDPDELVARAVVDLVVESGRRESVSVSSFWTGALATADRAMVSTSAINARASQSTGQPCHKKF